MTSINVTVNESVAQAVRSGKLTTHMVGVPVSFTFDGTWDGLNKYAVFRCDNVVRDRSLILSNTTTVPHEVLHKADEHLYVGVEGRAGDGTVVIPTTWADAGVVLDGANVSGVRGEDPTPDAYDDIMAAIQSGILRGPEGPKGDKGDIPIKGVDYHTVEDRDSLVKEVTDLVKTKARNINFGKLTANERMSIINLRTEDWSDALILGDNLYQFVKWAYERANIDIGYSISSVEATFAAMFDMNEDTPQENKYRLLKETAVNKSKLAMLVPNSYGGNDAMKAHGYFYGMDESDYITGDIFCSRFSKMLSDGRRIDNCDLMAICQGNRFLTYINFGDEAPEPYEITYYGHEEICFLINGLGEGIVHDFEGCTPEYYYVLRPENIGAEDTVSLRREVLQKENVIRGLIGTIENTVFGDVVSINDALDLSLKGLTIYGKTTQDTIPSPEAPAAFKNVGSIGSIQVTIADGAEEKVQSMVVSTPYGLPGIPVASGGNYTDASGQQWISDEIDFARGVRVQRIVQAVLDGSEGWGVYFPNDASFYHRFSDLGYGINEAILCDRLPYALISNSTTHTGIRCVNSASYGNFMIYVRLPAEYKGSITTADEFKAWLADHPLNVLIALETPTETPLSAEELSAYSALHTNKPNTSVYTNRIAGLKVEYVADTKTYIDNKFAELAAAIVANT